MVTHEILFFVRAPLKLEQCRGFFCWGDGPEAVSFRLGLVAVLGSGPLKSTRGNLRACADRGALPLPAIVVSPRRGGGELGITWYCCDSPPELGQRGSRRFKGVIVYYPTNFSAVFCQFSWYAITGSPSNLGEWSRIKLSSILLIFLFYAFTVFLISWI